jgi:hypothetical protein
MQKKAAVEMVVWMGLCKRQRACRTLGLSRSTAYYRRLASPQKLAQEGLVEEVSRQWPCLGYEKVAAIVRYEPRRGDQSQAGGSDQTAARTHGF